MSRPDAHPDISIPWRGRTVVWDPLASMNKLQSPSIGLIGSKEDYILAAGSIPRQLVFNGFITVIWYVYIDRSSRSKIRKTLDDLKKSAARGDATCVVFEPGDLPSGFTRYITLR